MLVSENRPEWLIADLAIMAAGGVTVPAYVTNTERDHQHILDNSGAKAVIVSTAKLAKPLLPAVLRSECCRAVIGMEDLRVGQSGDVAFHDWAMLIAAHAARHRGNPRRGRFHARATSPASSTHRAPAVRRAGCGSITARSCITSTAAAPSLPKISAGVTRYSCRSCR